MINDPLSLVIGYNCNLSHHDRDLNDNNVDDIHVAVNKLKEKVRATFSRCVALCFESQSVRT